MDGMSTIEMPVEDAKRRLAAYEQMLANDRTAEDDRIAAGYRAIARGYSVLRLSETIAAGGYFPNGMPRIAVGRADSQVCICDRGGGSWRDEGEHDFVFQDDRWRENRGALVGLHTVRVTVPFLEPTGPQRMWRGQTVVPTIPPEHRPKRRRLHGFHILWEVEEWRAVRRRRGVAPRDPALLRHIGGDLWAVVAVWDLTDLERAVIAGRT
jgi:hypothetical protein